MEDIYRKPPVKKKSSGLIVVVILLFAGMGCLGLGVPFVLFCGLGLMGYAIAPNEEIAELELVPGEEFTLTVPPEPGAEPMAHDVWLAFDVEHELLDDEPWGLQGWVAFDGIEFEVDISPGADGILGYPSEWEEDLITTDGYAWGESEGELLLGSIPPAEGDVAAVVGELWPRPGTDVRELRVFVRK